MGSSAKRLLFLVHRWLGIALCVFFAMWFVSGVVMMYVGYPKLTDAERLRHLPTLDARAPLLPPARALALAGVAGPLKELRLARASAGQEVYLAVPLQPAAPAARKARPGAGTIVVDARSGARLRTIEAEDALASAAVFAAPGTGLTYLGAMDEDAFTHSRALDAHRPLHKVMLADPDATVLYVSGRTGEVVRDAPLQERLWNYAGAWIHWLYPFRGNVFDRYWTDIVNWLSIAGIAMALSGTVVGILRWRFRRTYRSGARTPYTGTMMRWHHIGGLLFALVTITWIFSGLMSMNPWRVFDSGAHAPRAEALAGGPLVLSAADVEPSQLLGNAQGQVRELRWIRVLGRTVVQAWSAGGQPALLDSASARTVMIDRVALRAASMHLLPEPPVRIEQLSKYDLHYYAREPHTMTGGGAKPLPVWRVVFADAEATWAYVDPYTGTLVSHSDRHKRLSRWLFAMLHSWDWLPLLERRPLWDLLLIVLSIGGTVMSVTGIVIGWRRLGHKLGRWKKASSGT